VPEKSLGERLRRLRERQGITQETMAKWLGVSRSTLGSIESGEKQPGLSVLESLAYHLGCDPKYLLQDSGDIDPLLVMLRADPRLQESEEDKESVRKCIHLSREIAYLEGILGIDRGEVSSIRYPSINLEDKLDAIRQGERAAEHERRRLGLGDAPIENMISLLEGEGIITSQVPLEVNISGVSILSGRDLFIFVNRTHPVARRRFSMAHEYAHALFDLREDARFIISLDNEGGILREVRANAFAASLLAPEAGCRAFVLASGKGRHSRVEYLAPSGEEVIQAKERNLAAEQSLQPYDILLIARRFGISAETAAYRLVNLRLLNDEPRDRFLEDLKSGALTSLRKLIPDPGWYEDKEDFSFSSRLLGLALEARRRGAISTGRLVEVANLVDISRDDVEDALASLEIVE